VTYQVLARKWRPRRFADMVGQRHVLQALTNALDNDRLHHAYLFTGTRGVGKTTLARLFAKAINCEQGVSSTPCGECPACREVDQGRFVDLIEVDAASRTKVDDTRDLLDNVQFAATAGRFKVYLIDEVHMFSNHSFNALLKTLEEPPAHVKFLLATTDPKKLPVTILSRCLQFNLTKLSRAELARHLEFVLTEEGVAFEAPALMLLAEAAEGSARDSLSLLDQAIAFCGDTVTEVGVAQMLGTIRYDQVERILEAVLDADGARLIREARSLLEAGVAAEAAFNEILNVLTRCAVAQFAGDAIETLEDEPAVVTLAGRLDPEQTQLLYQIALNARRDLGIAPDPSSAFEMALIRMLAFAPGGSGGGARATTLPSARPAGAAVAASANGAAEASRAVEAGDANVADRHARASASTEQQARPAGPGDATLDRADTPVGADQDGHVGATVNSSRPFAGSAASDAPADATRGTGRPNGRVHASGEARGRRDAHLSHDARSAAAEADADAAVANRAAPAEPYAEWEQRAAPPPVEPSPSTAAGRTSGADAGIGGPLAARWAELVACLEVDGRTRALAESCALTGIDDARWRLEIAESHAVMARPEIRAALEAALTAQTGEAVTIDVTPVADTGGATPHERAQAALAERQREAESAVHEDAAVQVMKEMFDAQVETVRPRSS